MISSACLMKIKDTNIVITKVLKINFETIKRLNEDDDEDIRQKRVPIEEESYNGYRTKEEASTGEIDFD